MNSATWINGKKSVSGYWVYNYSADNFTVFLNSKDRITGQKRRFIVCGDFPEWGNWKLVK